MLDTAVRWQGSVYRLLIEGNHGGLFNREGLALQVFAERDTPAYRLPVLRDTQGNTLDLRHSTKPCSCKGAPWDQSPRALLDLILSQE